MAWISSVISRKFGVEQNIGLAAKFKLEMFFYSFGSLVVHLQDKSVFSLQLDFANRALEI